MANAGYGNHESSAPIGQAGSPGAAAKKPGGGTDRPGADLGGANDRSAALGPTSGARSLPDSQGTGPHGGRKDANSPTLSDDDRRDQSTPGAGALPEGPQGGDVDPGAG